MRLRNVAVRNIIADDDILSGNALRLGLDEARHINDCELRASRTLDFNTEDILGKSSIDGLRRVGTA